MATTLTARGGVQIKESIYAWEGKDKSGKTVRGELRAGGEAMVHVTRRRQGNLVTVRRDDDGNVTEVQVSGSGSNRAFQAQLRAARKAAGQ